MKVCKVMTSKFEFFNILASDVDSDGFKLPDQLREPQTDLQNPCGYYGE